MLNRMKPALCAAVLAVVSAACSATPGSVQTQEPTSHVELAVYTPAHATLPATSIECSAEEPTNAAAPTSSASLLGHMDGVWRRCGGASPTAGREHDGIEVDSTGRVFMLHKDAAGALVRTTGFKAETFVDPVENQDSWWAYEVFADGGFAPREASFSTSGNTMRWSHSMAAGEDIYVRTSEPVTGPLTGVVGARLGSVACALPEAGISSPFISTSGLQSSLSGRWIVCGEPFQHSGSAGIEFEGNNWYLLRDLNGTLVRSTASIEHGTLSLQDGQSVGGATEARLALDSADGRFLTPVGFSEAPVKLQIYNMGDGPFVYSALR